MTVVIGYNAAELEAYQLLQRPQGRGYVADAVATTNFIHDPRGVTLAQHTAGANITLAAVTGQAAPYGITTAIRMTATGVPGTATIPTQGEPVMTAGNPVSMRVAVACDAGTVGKTVTFMMRAIGGAQANSTLASTSIVLSTTYTLYTLTANIDFADRTNITLRFDPGTYASGDVMYYTAIQKEMQSYSTPHCDGSLGNGYAWLGAANASRSTRGAG